jgi:hypothetical protein
VSWFLLGVAVAAGCWISHYNNSLVGPGSYAVTYFAFQISTEMKITNKHMFLLDVQEGFSVT